MATTKKYDHIDEIHNLAGNNDIHAINSLRNNGYYTCSSIVRTDKRKLAAILNSDDLAGKLYKKACERSGLTNFRTVNQIDEEKQISKISSGSAELDKLIGGGIQTKTITEFFGLSCTGKTQMCQTLAVNSQINSKSVFNFIAGKCIYISTEELPDRKRFVNIASRYKLDVKKVTDNIVCAQAFSADHLLELLNKAAGFLAENRASLLIVDCIMTLIRKNYEGNNLLSDQETYLQLLLGKLQKLSDDYCLAVVITNNTIGGLPDGGNTFSYAIPTRLNLKYNVFGERVCAIYKSSWLPKNEAKFTITEKGIVDVEKK